MRFFIISLSLCGSGEKASSAFACLLRQVCPRCKATGHATLPSLPLRCVRCSLNPPVELCDHSVRAQVKPLPPTSAASTRAVSTAFLLPVLFLLTCFLLRVGFMPRFPPLFFPQVGISQSEPSCNTFAEQKSQKQPCTLKYCFLLGLKIGLSMIVWRHS